MCAAPIVFSLTGGKYEKQGVIVFTVEVQFAQNGQHDFVRIVALCLEFLQNDV